MSSPPPQEAVAASHGPESSDWPDANEADFDLRESILKLFPTTYNDPTGQRVIRKLQRLVGYFEPDAEMQLLIKSKARGNFGVRLDFEMKSMVTEIVERFADVTPTQAGRNYRARIKKNNPTAVEFGDRNSGGVHTETPIN